VSSSSSSATAGSVPIREIQEDELARWVEVVNATEPEPVSEEGLIKDFLDWKRQAPQTVWLLAEEAGTGVGAGRLTPGWHSPPGVARADVRVLPVARRCGIGSALLGELQGRADALGAPTLSGEVRDDDPGSLAWAERNGFREVGRSVRLALDLTAIDEPAVDPPAGIEVVTWAERPELARGIYEVACEAYPDEPGTGDAGVEPFEGWLSQDMQGSGDRADAVFVALAGGEVAGYAKLAMSVRPGYVLHDMTGVKRSFRGRGIASALKRAEIAWAKREGFRTLETLNHELNAPIRALNEKHGYRPASGSVTLRRSAPAV
jgi:GNAT superfamily N-acetyltransferase